MKKSFKFLKTFKLIWKTATKVFLVFIFFAFLLLSGLGTGFGSENSTVLLSIATGTVGEEANNKKTKKVKDAWKKIKTTYLENIQKFNITEVGEVDISNIKEIENKETAYDDLKDETKAELENLVLNESWETTLKNLISVLVFIEGPENTRDVYYKKRLAWKKIKTTYLADIKKFNITKVGEVDISNIRGIKDTSATYESLSVKTKAELKALTDVLYWETILQLFIVRIWLKIRIKTAWTKIQNNYLDDIRSFNITKVGKVDIPNIKGIVNKTTAYEDLGEDVKAELNNLALDENWETTLENLIESKPKGRVKVAWIKIKTKYLDDIQKFNIEKIGKVDISNIKEIANKNTAYDSLLPVIKTELGNLVNDSNWQTTLKNAIGEEQKKENVWFNIKENYLDDIQSFNITKVGEVDISNLESSAEKNTAYKYLSNEIKIELNNLVVVQTWEVTLKGIITKVKQFFKYRKQLSQLIVTTKAKGVWKFLQDKIAILKANKITAIVGKKIDLILKENKDTGYENLDPTAQTQLKDLIILNDYEKKINAVVQKAGKVGKTGKVRKAGKAEKEKAGKAGKAGKDGKDGEDGEDWENFPLALVLGVTIPIVLLIALVASYFIFKKTTKKST